MNYFRMSNGERISKAKIDRNVRKAKEEVLQDQLNGSGFNFCQTCSETGYPKEADEMELRIIDCAHLISVDNCQKHGKAEFAWDKNNIMPLCRHHHRVWDRSNLSFKK